MDGAHIVLVTARPEVFRELLVKSLHAHGLVYHQLVMGVTSGERVLVNDQKLSGKAATAIEMTRNSNIGDWI
jgi:hypothetical protein